MCVEMFIYSIDVCIVYTYMNVCAPTCVFTYDYIHTWYWYL